MHQITYYKRIIYPIVAGAVVTSFILPVFSDPKHAQHLHFDHQQMQHIEDSTGGTVNYQSISLPIEPLW